MKKIVMFDTSYATRNLGDFIINNSINEEMNYLLSDSFVVRYSTHTPLCTFLKPIKNDSVKNVCSSADYKFICGTNIFKKRVWRIGSDWNLKFESVPYYKNSITIGCGMTGKKVDIFSKILYKKILSKEYYHSTRDEKTKVFLESLGLKAINTGCATMWKLTQEHCKKISTGKAKNVVFTLTDYKRDLVNDQKLIDILIGNYENVYFWIQGEKDYEYFKTFKGIDKVKIISPSVEQFKKVLLTKDVDYVGTRLHAGIFAMQHFVRTIILIVDNRTRDMKETYDLIAMERNDIDQLEKMINSEFKTNIKIDEDKIQMWKSQFK